MIISVNNRRTEFIQPMYTGRTVIIGIDSSKTNTAITFRSATGVILDIVELNGSEDGTTMQDTIVLCKKQREALDTILEGAKVYAVGIENIITTERTEVLNTHMSRFKITHVFSSLIVYFQDKWGIIPKLINNWDWKVSELPEEFRSRKYDKGSIAYFRAIKSPYGAYSDDATDSICISSYLCKQLKIQMGHKVGEPELSHKDFTCVLVPMNMYDGLKAAGAEIFIPNEQLDIQQNSIYIANRNLSKLNIAVFKTKDISLQDIYAHCAGPFKEMEKELLLCVTID